MNFRRALVLADLRADPAPAISALWRVAPALERVLVVSKVGTAGAWWSEPRSDPDERELGALRRRQRSRGVRTRGADG